ncbi:MAG TPA: hypothetical protein VM344_08190, partial [Vitreimonas sp.]|nr:hypothetical protein [Vitreimonas sp.]
MTRPHGQGWRTTVRRMIDRLPVGRGLVLRVARGVAHRVDGRASRGSASGGRVPRNFQVSPAPRRIDGPWPEPPLVDQ